MLQVFIGQDDRWEGRPLADVIVERLRKADVAGATVCKGVMGYGAHQRLHASRHLGLSKDLPVVVMAVDSDAKIRAVMPQIEAVVSEGLLILSDVNVVASRHGVAGEV
jgi:PII-like signaling protein